MPARVASQVVRRGLKRTYGLDFTQESSGTSQISIIDGQGNALSMTTTIESAFGSRQWSAGFLLNNELTDFSFRPKDGQGRRIANAVAGGKRPRSSMAPTIVFGPDGKVKAVLGSPGGSRIILYVIKTLVGIIDWKLDAQAAAALTNFGARRSAFEVEQSLSAPMLGFAHEGARPCGPCRAHGVWHAYRRSPSRWFVGRWCRYQGGRALREGIEDRSPA